jgi:hypothetical protein
MAEAVEFEGQHLHFGVEFPHAPFEAVSGWGGRGDERAEQHLANAVGDAAGPQSERLLPEALVFFFGEPEADGSRLAFEDDHGVVLPMGCGQWETSGLSARFGAGLKPGAA